MADLSIQGSIEYELIGFSKDLNQKMLPTLADVLKYVYFLRESGVTAKNPKLKSVNEIIPSVIEGLKQVWIKASIPQVISDNGIRKKVMNEIDKLKKAKKNKI